MSTAIVAAAGGAGVDEDFEKRVLSCRGSCLPHNIYNKLGQPARARARKTLGFLRCATCGSMSMLPFVYGPKRAMGRAGGPKKLIFLIRDIDDATMAGASVESCQFVVLRCLRSVA